MGERSSKGLPGLLGEHFLWRGGKIRGNLLRICQEEPGCGVLRLERTGSGDIFRRTTLFFDGRSVGRRPAYGPSTPKGDFAIPD